MVTDQTSPHAKRNLARLFVADLILRWAYQVGKTPLLPLLAAALGAAEVMTGLVVAVSTFTGIILKPVFGILSDRNGRRIWLLLALALFIILPFLYRFVETPEQLFALRLIHGLATAIFGPVSLSYVADIGNQDRASRLAIFGMARSTAALLAPLSAGYILTYYPIETVFTAIGFLSLIAAFPLLMLSESAADKPTTKTSLTSHFGAAIKLSVATPAIWLAGMLELIVYLVTYAVRAFLPLFILSHDGGTILQAGLFFSLQEAANIALRPIGGWFADRKSNGAAIQLGLLLLAVGVSLLPSLSGWLILISAILIGFGQAMILPASLAFLAGANKPGHLGAGMGFYGALRNVGKVSGPVIAGILLTNFDFTVVFTGFAVVVGGAAIIAAISQQGAVRRN